MSKKRIKRVMLVYPNQLWFKQDLSTTWNLNPYTLCLLATMIKDDVDVKIVDAQFYNLTQEDFKKEIVTYNPQLVGISMLCSEYADIGHTTAQLVKEVNEDIIVVMGGVHVTTLYWEVMKDHNIDYAITGEAEYVFRDFIRHLNDEGDMPKKGMVLRKDNGGLEAYPKELIENLDDLPFVDYSFVDFEAYGNKVQRYGIDSPSRFPFLRMPTGRGCPIGCSFCQVENISGGPFRYRSAENLVEELETLIDKYGLKSLNFEDDNAFYNKSRTKKLMELFIEKKIDLKWKANGVAIFSLNENLIDLMAQAGCEMINIAIESGVERVLKEIVHKPMDLEKAPKMISYARSKGIFICVNFIIGFPGETWNEIRETLRYADNCGADYVKIFIANPIQGTKLYDIARNMDVIMGDENQINWRYSSILTNEFTPIDISILRAYEWDRINFTDPDKRKRTAEVMNISEEELENIRYKTRLALDLESLSKEVTMEKSKKHSPSDNLVESEGYPLTELTKDKKTSEETENLLNMAKMMN